MSRNHCPGQPYQKHKSMLCENLLLNYFEIYDAVTRFLPKAPIIANFGGNTTFTTFDNRLTSLNTLL